MTAGKLTDFGWDPSQPLRHDATSRDIDRRTAFINDTRATHPQWGRDPRPGRELALQEFAEAVQTFNEHGIKDTHLVIRESGAAGECWIVDREGQRFPIEMPKFSARYDAVNVLRTVLNEIMESARPSEGKRLATDPAPELAQIKVVPDPSMPTESIPFLVAAINLYVREHFNCDGSKVLPRYPTPRQIAARREFLLQIELANRGYPIGAKRPLVTEQHMHVCRTLANDKMVAELQRSTPAPELAQIEGDTVRSLAGVFQQRIRCGKCGSSITRADLTRHTGECPKRHESALAVESVLSEADYICNGDRQKDYGDFGPSWRKIARGWSLVLDIEVTPQQAVRCMQWLKIARNCFKSKRDNNVDLAAYAHIERSLDEVDEANR